MSTNIPFTTTITVNDDISPSWDQTPGSLDRQFVCVNNGSTKRPIIIRNVVI